MAASTAAWVRVGLMGQRPVMGDGWLLNERWEGGGTEGLVDELDNASAVRGAPVHRVPGLGMVWGSFVTDVLRQSEERVVRTGAMLVSCPAGTTELPPSGLPAGSRCRCGCPPGRRRLM